MLGSDRRSECNRLLSLLLEVGIIHDRFDYSNYYYGTIDRQLPCVTLHNGQAHSGAPSAYSKQKQSSRRLVIGRGVCSEYSPRASVASHSQACGMHVQCQGHSPFITSHHCKVNMSAVNLTNWTPFGGC